MIEKKLAVEIMSDFSGMPATPTEDGDIERRLKSLQMHSRSESHARAVALRLISRLKFFPTVADIVQECISTLDPHSAEAIEQSKQCPYCRGDGFRSVDGPYGTSAAFPCDHTGRMPNMGVKLPAAVEKMYRRDALNSVERAKAFDAMAAKNPKKFQMRRAQIPDAIREAIEQPKVTQEDISAADRTLRELREQSNRRRHHPEATAAGIGSERRHDA